MTKTCARCEHEKGVAEFNRNSRSKDGLQSECRDCFRERHQARARFTRGTVESKWCAHCEQTLPAASFNTSIVDKSGLQSYCRSCHTKYYRSKGYAYTGPRHKKLRDKKLAYIREIMARSGCARCPENDIACLHLHHVDPSVKEGRPLAMANQNATIARINAEMAKCVVLCSNCHMKLHHAERHSSKQDAVA